MNNELTLDLNIVSLSMTDLVAKNDTITIHLTNYKDSFVNEYKLFDNIKLQIKLDLSNEDLTADEILNLRQAQCIDDVIECSYTDYDSDLQLDVIGINLDKSVKLLSRFEKIKIESM